MPPAITRTPGQAHESTQVQPLLDAVDVGGRPGPRRRRLRAIAADKAYDGAPMRRAMCKAGSRPVVAHNERPDGRYAPGAARFDKQLYRRRNIVERRNGHLKEHRRIATRDEKLAVNFAAMIQLAIVPAFIKHLLASTA